MSQRTGGYTKNRPRKCPIRNMQIMYAKFPQLYGCIEQSLGNCNFKVMTLDGEVKTASPRNTIKKQSFLRLKDWVLIEPLSSDEDKKYQIIFKYTPEQYKILEKEGCLKKQEDPYKKTQESESIQYTNIDVPDDDDGLYFEDADVKEKKEDNFLEINQDFIDLI